MALAKLSMAQATSINLARNHANDADRKAVKKEIFSAAKVAFGIPADTKLKAETSNRAAADFLVLKDKNGKTFELGTDGRWTGAAPTVQGNPSRWFKVNDVRKLLTEAIVMEANDEDFDKGLEMLPAGAVERDGVAGDTAGNLYVLISKDQF